MTALIVGGDYIKPLEKIIADRGVAKVEHWTGRKPGDLKKSVPKGTRLVVLLYDYLSHSLAKKVRNDADRLGLPVIYCRRSMGEFCSKLDELLEAGGSAVKCTAGPELCDSCPLNGKSRKRN